MKSVTKLKDEARKHEQNEQWDPAIQAYLQVLKTGEEGEGELDLPLYNRVGDLYLRLNRPHDAVQYYAQAADRYAEAGLFNNAIALCNKALRYVPEHDDLLRKLGQFSASQGFLTDAKRYFLQYAERRSAANDVDNALTALAEFAELSDDAEVRAMLGRQLHTNGRTPEAVDELKKAHAIHLRNGNTDAAQQLSEEVEQIEPGAMSAADAPTVMSTPHREPAESEDDFSFVVDSPANAASVEEAEEDDSPLPEIGDEASLEGLESTHFEIAVPEDTDDFQLPGFEATHTEAEPMDLGGLSGFESTTFESPDDVEAEPLAGLELDETSFDDIGGIGDDTEDAPDLPLLSDDEAPSFDLPSFNIESAPSDTDPDADGDTSEDVHFDLPLLDPEHAEPGDTLDFGEHGSQPLSAFNVEPSDEEPTDEDERATAFVDDLIADAAAPDWGDWTDPSTDAAAFAPDAEVAPEPAADPFEAEPDFELGAAREPEPAPEEEVERSDSAFSDAFSMAPEAPPAPVMPEAPDLSPAEPTPPSPEPAAAPPEYVDLGALFAEEDEPAEDTRFVVQEKAPTGDEDRDFAELLSQFKQKVSQNVAAEDSGAHYDLGLAFKEMGLINEAIGEFQIAMRAPELRLRVYEELGQCFLLKEEYNIAEKVLTRALELEGAGGDIEMIGVYYHLGCAYEGLNNRERARDAYEHVLGLDINFRDVASRLARL